MDLSGRNKISLTEEEKWDAVLACDKSRDGVFFYGVGSTRIFCRPSCRSRVPLRGNIHFFDTAAEAMKSGFRACRKCRPDLLIYDPGREMVEKLKELYRNFFFAPDVLEKERLKLGLGETQRQRLFRQYEGCAPGRFLRDLRMAAAEEKLQSGKATVADIAFDCGFESLSAFYRLFKKRKGVSPLQYRRRVQSFASSIPVDIKTIKRKERKQ